MILLMVTVMEQCVLVGDAWGLWIAGDMALFLLVCTLILGALAVGCVVLLLFVDGELRTEVIN